jgi:hypothetical protein
VKNGKESSVKTDKDKPRNFTKEVHLTKWVRKKENNYQSPRGQFWSETKFDSIVLQLAIMSLNKVL